MLCTPWIPDASPFIWRQLLLQSSLNTTPSLTTETHREPSLHCLYSIWSVLLRVSKEGARASLWPHHHTKTLKYTSFFNVLNTKYFKIIQNSITQKIFNIKMKIGASLVAQWLRICLPMQGTRVRALVWKIPHAAERLGPWATITEPAGLEPVLRNKRGRDSERPAHRDEEWPPLAAIGESLSTETKTQHSQK